jgi:hypothetical protein
MVITFKKGNKEQVVHAEEVDYQYDKGLVIIDLLSHQNDLKTIQSLPYGALNLITLKWTLTYKEWKFRLQKIK